MVLVMGRLAQKQIEEANLLLKFLQLLLPSLLNLQLISHLKYKPHH